VSRILVADDEAAIRKVVRDALEKAGHDVETAIDGEEASRIFEEGGGELDLVVTDLNMPKMDGLELVRRIRRTSSVPVLVLTVRQEEREKVRLLDAGADDYVTKPFGVAELLARARALLRRADTRPASPPVMKWGDVELDPSARTVRRAGAPVHLTPIEFSLLLALASKPGGVWTHKQLLAEVWGSSAGISTDTLRVHMGSLRRKLEPDPNRPRFIRTEPWVGYRFSPEPD
jgi:two-component system KDP operon response regulator KdpE